MDYDITHHSRLLINLWKWWFKPGYHILMLKLKFQCFGHPMWTADSLGKSLMLGKTEGRRRGHQRMRCSDGISSAMGWTWANFGRRWGTGKPDGLQPTGSQRVRHDWATTATTSTTTPRTSLARSYRYSEVDQLCPTLWDPMDCRLPGSSVHGIFQAIVLEWIAISFAVYM